VHRWADNGVDCRLLQIVLEAVPIVAAFHHRSRRFVPRADSDDAGR